MAEGEITIPRLKDLTVDNITENVKLINSQGPNPRLQYILERAVQHIHDFARETRLSHEEWMTGVEFLTKVGKQCTDVRQEFILLSDVLGLSLLVESIAHPRPPKSTQGTVLGPFHTHEARDTPNGANISGDSGGKPCFVLCSVKDMQGRPIEGAKIDVWEANSQGLYDVQLSDFEGPDNRAVLHSDRDGLFWFKAIVPVPYPIPSDGPVGHLLDTLARHYFRPSHMHFMFEKAGYDKLITALYLRGDRYEATDAVFGVKNSLLIDVGQVDSEMASKYDVEQGSNLISYDFVLVTDEEVKVLRDSSAMDAMRGLGLNMKLWNGLPVPDVD